jgi:putrescine carbamoyltransferase
MDGACGGGFERPRHFIEAQDIGRLDALRLCGLARLIKDAARAGARPKLLEGASLAMIFEAPSTRTRLSFEVAMTQLGGQAVFLRPGDLHLGGRESLADTARVLSRMVDGVVARTLRHQTLRDLAEAAEVPVINGMCDRAHPVQALCDVFTMLEHRPAGKPVGELRVAFVGGATNVCLSLMTLCAALGMHFVHACPERFEAPEADRRQAAARAAAARGSLAVTRHPAEAVRDADFVYADALWRAGQEAEMPDRIAAFMPGYQVTPELMARAPAHAKFMHCLPAGRGEEVVDAVLDGDRSIVLAQAENRLHMQKALLTLLLRDRRPRAAPDVAAWHRDRIERFLEG